MASNLTVGTFGHVQEARLILQYYPVLNLYYAKHWWETAYSNACGNGHVEFIKFWLRIEGVSFASTNVQSWLRKDTYDLIILGLK